MGGKKLKENELVSPRDFKPAGRQVAFCGGGRANTVLKEMTLMPFRLQFCSLPQSSPIL